ncbi:hypothetical protein M3J09_002657 [Ascochyta lentis]
MVRTTMHQWTRLISTWMGQGLVKGLVKDVGECPSMLVGHNGEEVGCPEEWQL